MTLTLLLFVLGFALLVKGADFLVDGATSLAKRLGVSSLVIGLTVVAFGTSLPELVVSTFASFRGNADIAIGNILGSSTANILLILGISTAIVPLAVARSTVWKEIPFSLLAVLSVAFLVNDARIDAHPALRGGMTFVGLTRTDGLSLLAFFAIFMYYVVGLARSSTNGDDPNIARVALRPLPVTLGAIAVGLVALVIGGRWVVDGAVVVARALGVSDALIGLTVVAVGISLPEFATSVVAAYRRQPDIAVGNVVGSNIFNVFFVLGVSALIAPLPFSPALMADVVMVVLATTLLFLAMFVGKRHAIDRWQGIAFLGIYLLYVAYLIARG